MGEPALSIMGITGKARFCEESRAFAPALRFAATSISIELLDEGRTMRAKGMYSLSPSFTGRGLG